jgi:hypothetical protein
MPKNWLIVGLVQIADYRLEGLSQVLAIAIAFFEALGSN